MNEQRSFILAIGLSIAVLIGWQVLVGIPQMEKKRAHEEATQQQQQTSQSAAPAPGATGPAGTAPAPGTGGAAQTPAVPGNLTRAQALASSPRLAIATPSLEGSIALKGAAIDDLKLLHHHVDVDPDSPYVTLLSPPGTTDPFFVEQGWAAAPGSGVKVPGADTLWTSADKGPLAPGHPVTVDWDNGAGLVFHRTFDVDSQYMFTVTQSVNNGSDAEVTLFPYSLVKRYGTPAEHRSFYLLHEGLIGYLGEQKQHHIDYSDVAEGPAEEFEATGGWIGITDKYWAAVVIPDQAAHYKARFTATGELPIYQTDYLLDGVKVEPGAATEITSRVFAGAKRVSVIDSYQQEYGILEFSTLVDWGYLFFITKPMFHLLDFLNGLIGNFGVAILIATVLIKLAFFPLANKSYVSMSRMKRLQPEMLKLRERYKDDRAKQQQELMALYKREKVNPMAGCLPIVIQIPVFFALYSVLFVTIEMRHQPFFGWIQDLSAPDPTTVFNLFGLIPWDPPSFLMIGVWPLIMGTTMFLQMRLNPLPADPVQQQIFTWMPIVFTFMLARFSSGLVIYWAWNNTLSIIQQYVIMRRQGVRVDLLGNIVQTFRPKKAVAEKKG